MKAAILSSFDFQATKVAVYGSTAQGTYLRNSDMDVAIIDEDQIVGPSTRLRKLKSVLQQIHWVDRLQMIDAKVPILKFKDTVSGLHVDISAGKPDGL